MAQIKSGLKTILEQPIVYSVFQTVLGSRRSTRTIIDQYLKFENGMKVLDIGCGPADILDQIDQRIDYLGIDFENAYIEKARKRYGDRGQFFCKNALDLVEEQKGSFDRILVLALLHHLEDKEVDELLSALSKLLAKDGFLFILENTFTSDQSFLARKIIEMDRGLNVREPEGYLRHCRKYFANCKSEIRHDLLRIPYTHILISCSN